MNEPKGQAGNSAFSYQSWSAGLSLQLESKISTISTECLKKGQAWKTHNLKGSYQDKGQPKFQNERQACHKARCTKSWKERNTQLAGP